MKRFITAVGTLIVVAALVSGADSVFSYYSESFTLQNNSQCSGGTLIDELNDVQDTGAAISAKPLATSDCRMLITGADQCCQVQYRRSTPKAPAIGSHVFTYQLFQGGTVVPSTPPAGTLTSSFQHWAGVSGPATPTPVTASLVANPNAIVNGEQSLLTWSSTGASSCVGTNFSTGNAISGSVLVSPTQTTQYTVTCTGAGGSSSSNYWTETGYLPGKCVSVTCPSAVGTTVDPVSCSTAGATCQMCDGAPAGDANSVIALYQCQAGGSGNSATARTTVTVTDPDTAPAFSVSCRAHPTQANRGEDVLWSSTVTGGEGTYTYSWSGSEGLSGSGNQVFKQYSSSGEKTASLTVTFTPNVPQSASTPPPPEPPPPPSSTPPPSQLPIGNVCPALGFVTPISPCSGVWAPTYDTGGCQTGWQCIPLTGGGSGGGIILQDTPTFTDGLFDIFNFESPTIQRVPEIQTVDGSILGATAMTVAHTEGELFTSAPTVKQDMLANGGVSFTETTFVGRTLAADQVTMNRVCSVLHGDGSTATQIGARGYSSCGNNSNIQFSGGRWAVVSGCTGAHLSGSFSCIVTSTGSAPTTQCSAATVTVVQPVPEPETETITVQCENSVQIGASQCSDGIDNDGDGDIDNGEDAGCDSDGDDDEDDDNPPPQCSDGIDNDGDGDIDNGQDTGCDSDNDDDESDGPPQCSDDADNDDDTKVDYPQDPGCISPQDDDETNAAQQCTQTNICRGTDVYRRNVDCSETFVQNCPHGCSNGACLPAGGGAGGLILNPSAPIVASGKTVTISWSAVGFVADSCTLVGTNGDSWVLSGSQGSVVTRPLSSSAEYTLTCTDGVGNRVSKRITVKVSPRFEEI